MSEQPKFRPGMKVRTTKSTFHMGMGKEIPAGEVATIMVDPFVGIVARFEDDSWAHISDVNADMYEVIADE